MQGLELLLNGIFKLCFLNGKDQGARLKDHTMFVEGDPQVGLQLQKVNIQPRSAVPFFKFKGARVMLVGVGDTTGLALSIVWLEEVYGLRNQIEVMYI